MGGWPVARGENHESPLTWQQVVEQAIEIGFSIEFPVKFSAVSNLHVNSSQIILQVSSGELSISREILLQKANNITLQSYHQHQVDMAVRFGADRERAKMEMFDVLEFEISLANVRN